MSDLQGLNINNSNSNSNSNSSSSSSNKDRAIKDSSSDLGSTFIHGNSNMDPSSSNDDTPMALLEQLVYIDNFFQQSDSPNVQGSDNFDDQLQRELAAFANDTFIFPDEDKPKQASSNGEGSSGNKAGAKNPPAGNGGNSDNLLSFAQASFEQISPADMSSVSSPIPPTHYQNLSQRYNNSKQKFTYQESMSQHMTTIPSTIHELLGSGNAAASTSPANLSAASNAASANPPPTTINPAASSSRSNNNSNASDLFDNPRARHHATNSTSTSSTNPLDAGEARKVQVPQGAQNTLAAAGLSQTQIDALASLVAFHKSDSLGKAQASSGASGQFPPFNLQSSQPSTPQNFQLLQELSNQQRQQQPQQPQQPQQAPSNNSNNVNNLLVGLLTQSLVNNVGSPQQQPQQQQQQPQNNLASSLLSLLAGNAFDNGNQGNVLNLLLQLQQQQQQQQQQQALNLQSILSNQIQGGGLSTLSNTPNSTQLTGSAGSPTLAAGSNNKKQTLTFKNSLLDMSKSTSEPVVRKSTSSFNSIPANTKNTSSISHAPGSSSSSLQAAASAIAAERKEGSSKAAEPSSGNSSATSSHAAGSGDSARTAKGTASVRFRQKKKLKEQEMEKNLQEAKEVADALQARIQQLEMENRLLRDLVVEKSHQRDSEEVERLRKKARLQVKGKE